MARTSEGKRLTEVQRVAQVRQATKTLVKARIAYNRFLATTNLDGAFPTWAVLMDQIVTQGFVDSAALATPYVEKFAAAEGAKIPDLPQVAIDHAKLIEDLQVNGPISIKQKIAKGFEAEAAKAASAERLLGVVQEYVLGGGRSLIIGASHYYGSSGRWRRVTDGQPCTFCGMLAGRGPVYAEETVNFRPHTKCGCGAELVFGEWEPTEKERLWRASYDLAAMDADDSKSPRVAPVRKENKSEDSILWRMRRNAPQLFSDGVYPKQ